MATRTTIANERPRIVRRYEEEQARAARSEEVGVERTAPPRRRRRSWKWSIALFLTKTTVVGSICVVCGRVAQYAWNETVVKVEEARAVVLDKLTVTKIVREVKEVDDATLGEIVEKVADEHSVDPLILQVILAKESSNGRELYRFEPELYERFKERNTFPKESDNELRMLASSHGNFHVLGATALQQCNLHWSRLYEPLTSARCAASIVARLHREAGRKPPSDKLWAIFKGYNGSGPRAEKYANEAMKSIADRLYQKVSG